MNIVSNFIGSISPEMFNDGAKGLTQNIDLSDNTFSDLLEKQINNGLQKNNQNFFSSLGLPSEIYIGSPDETFSQLNIKSNMQPEEKNDMLESIKPINESENSDISNFKNTQDMSTSEVVTFFSSLFDSKPSVTDTSSTDLFDFEKKVAAGNYNKYSRSVITDINEFVVDTMKMKSEV